MIRFLVVRHGESDWNLAGRVQGQADGPVLTEAGRRQAREAAELLAGLGATRLISSDLTRAVETAEIIAARLGLAVETEAALREQRLGDLEGRLAGELRSLPVPEGHYITEVRWGGGESVEDLHGRLTTYVHRLLAEADGQTLVLVTHAGTMQVLRAVADGQGHRAVEWGRVGHGQLLHLTLG